MTFTLPKCVACGFELTGNVVPFPHLTPVTPSGLICPFSNAPSVDHPWSFPLALCAVFSS